MTHRGLRKLEFHRILETVASGARTPSGKKLVLELTPAGCRGDAEILRLETLHGAALLQASIEPVLSGVEAASEAIHELNAGAIALEPSLLRGTGVFLGDIADFSFKVLKVKQDLPGILHGPVSTLPDLSHISVKLIGITTPDGELSPSASPALRKITRRIETLRSSLSSRLSSICAGFAGTGIIRDAPPTMRAGRFVIPVTASRKSSVRGIVHDRSDSGATVYIEPSQLVDAGNELQEAVLDLEQERRRILREATLLLRQELKNLEEGMETISILDMIFARSRYHLKYGTVFPDEGPVDLKDLVHPLLPVETAVKSHVKLPSDWRVLVVSGPNAGGKSVLLKAVALASVSSRAGLGVHAGASSTLPFFSSILVSMGDNQSIAMHLSTYSARLSEQKRILQEGGKETLAVIDEPAAGTDPVTGAALAAVFLERIADSGVRTIVSTHMGQLKLLAMDKPGFVNGSMSFNPETLAPGYRFIPDIPGASCTLEAAAIAGFPEDLLDEASRLSGDSFSLDSLVASLRELEENRKTELEELKRESKLYEDRSKRLRESIERIDKEAGEAALEAERERAEKLRSIQSRADSLLATLAGTGNRDQRLQARRKLSELAETESREAAAVSGVPAVKPSEPLSPGDRVKVHGWADTGTVEKVSRSSAMVRLGSMLVKKDLSLLIRVDTPETQKASSSEYQTPSESPEAMLLGLTVDEAVVELDIKLDNCTAMGLSRLRVVHGKGRLMKGVTDWLRRDRRVKSVSMASPEEGGTGASIVTVKG